MEEPSDPKVIRFGLVPSLQETNLTVLTHDTLRLHCASYSEKVSDLFYRDFQVFVVKVISKRRNHITTLLMPMSWHIHRISF